MEKVQIIAEIEIKQQYRDGLIPVLQKLVEGSRSEPGNNRYDFTENIAHPGHFFVIEEWASEKAVEEHNATPHFQNFVSAIEGKAEKLNIIKVKNLF
ncbi:MAG: antibiotic biosynthesis monooxygenase [Proteobacteria bacterium]|nr:antibiotic biosynthesis monooxygenase [Pseudomonadota bacterium]